MFINHQLKINLVIFYVVPAKSHTPLHRTRRHVWEMVTVMSGTDGVQTSNTRVSSAKTHMWERGGWEMGQQFEERKSVSSVKNICEEQSWTLGRYEDKSREEE